MSLKSRAAIVLGLVALALCALTPAALAESGTLDAAYGTAGKTQLPASYGTTTVEDSLMLADGSVVIVGAAGTGASQDAYVAKFTPAGTLDTTFGTSGVTKFNVNAQDAAYGVTLRSNGGFVVSGASDLAAVTSNAFIAKTTANGTLDSAWGTGGVVVTTGAPLAVVGSGIELTPGGDVAFAGVDESSVSYIQGTMPSGGDWSSTLPYGQYTDFTHPVYAVLGLVKRSDGLYETVSQSTDAGNTTTDLTVTVFDPGTPDPFITPIFQTTTSINSAAGASRIFLGAGDKLYVTGYTAPTAADPKRGMIWRFNADASLDSTFGTAGALLLPTATDGFVATGLAKDSAGKWYVNGDLGTDRVRTLRFNSNWSLDTAFGTSGLTDRSYGTTPNRTENVLIDASDRPVETGTLGSAAAVWRVERFNYAASQLGTVTYSPSFVQRLNTVTFHYSVKNSGPDASDVSVDIDIPASFQGQAYTASSGTATPVADGSGATWSVPQLAPGATATLTLTGKPSDVGTLKTTATILSQSAVRQGAAPAPASATATVFGAATPLDDVITGTPGRDVIDALAGNDIVYALAGNDVIDGNTGDDKLYGQDGNDVLRGGDGNDLVDGGNGDDTASGDAGNDHVLGRAGNDTVDGGAGNDVVDGGTGNDRVLGGSGNDRLYGRSGNDSLDSGDGNDLVFAGAGNDHVMGGSGADRLYGDTGNDYLIAQGSGDKLYGGPGRDRLDGGADNDQLLGGSGDDWLNGKTGNDRLDGNTGDDWLRGFEGNDVLNGGAGNDLLNGGAGHDVLNGGSGNDIIRADDGFGGDVVNCGSGWDLVYANAGDKIASNCEFVKYDVPAGTRFSGDRGADAATLWAERIRRG